ncbi:MAG: sensor histidine kinase [Chloroflexia bacterium]|nr:sensor histidine kinase [Chloroflexia bacterium]
MNQATDTDYAEVERAVDAAKLLVRSQLAQLRAEQELLTGLLGVRETDLVHLRVLVDDLTYRASSGQPSTSRKWVAHLEELAGKEQELRDAVHLLTGSLGHLNSLITAVSSVNMLGSGSDTVVGSNPLEAAIAGRTLQGQEAERSRLAREVHDGPAQVLANAIMGLEYCERLMEKRPVSVPTELQRLKAGMTDGLEEVRRFIFDLRPSSLEYEGLRVTLERYAANYQNRFGVTVEVACPDLDSMITSEQRFVVFRVIQEAMQNCRKHALASKLEIVVEVLSDHCAVSISDNGKGFDMEQGKYRPGHLGVQGMYERAESVQGRIILFSEPGYGTEVRMRVPLTTAP